MSSSFIFSNENYITLNLNHILISSRPAPFAVRVLMAPIKAVGTCYSRQHLDMFP
jgi:hypothetical protein